MDILTWNLFRGWWATVVVLSGENDIKKLAPIQAALIPSISFWKRKGVEVKVKYSFDESKTVRELLRHLGEEVVSQDLNLLVEGVSCSIREYKAIVLLSFKGSIQYYSSSGANEIGANERG
jgi:hypothetical protein